jgi:hypothetical protein
VVSARQGGPGSQDAQEYSLAEQQDEVGGRLSSNGEGQVEGQRGEHHRGAAARQRNLIAAAAAAAAARRIEIVFHLFHDY